MLDSRFGRAIRIGFASAALEIKVHRVRSTLSVLGAALAMAAATTMVALLRGTHIFLDRTIQELGDPGKVRAAAKPAPTTRERIMSGRSNGLRLSDADSLNRAMAGMALAFKSMDMQVPVRLRAYRGELTVRGLDRATLEQEERVLVQEGRFFSAREYREGSRVCIIGWKLEQEAVGAPGRQAASLVGERVWIDREPFTVVGVFTKAFRDWEAPGYRLYIPMETMRKDFSGLNPGLPAIAIRVDAGRPSPAVMESLAGRFKRLHNGIDDVELSGLSDLEDFRKLMRNLEITFLIIIAVAVCIGVTNIFNLMLSTLSERMVEIGVRKSLGASPGDVFYQFLAESLAISLLGGISGGVLGLAPLLFADAIEAATEGIRPTADFAAILMVLAISLATGILSGLYPALKASRLDPVAALRHS